MSDDWLADQLAGDPALAKRWRAKSAGYKQKALVIVAESAASGLAMGLDAALDSVRQKPLPSEHGAAAADRQPLGAAMCEAASQQAGEPAAQPPIAVQVMTNRHGR